MNEYLASFSSLPLGLRQPYQDFLHLCGLTDEGDCDHTVLLLDDSDHILACGSLRGNVLKQIAVDPHAEGSGFCAQVVTELVEEAFRRLDAFVFNP